MVIPIIFNSYFSLDDLDESSTGFDDSNHGGDNFHRTLLPSGSLASSGISLQLYLTGNASMVPFGREQEEEDLDASFRTYDTPIPLASHSDTPVPDEKPVKKRPSLLAAAKNLSLRKLFQDSVNSLTWNVSSSTLGDGMDDGTGFPKGAGATEDQQPLEELFQVIMQTTAPADVPPPKTTAPGDVPPASTKTTASSSNSSNNTAKTSRRSLMSRRNGFHERDLLEEGSRTNVGDIEKARKKIEDEEELEANSNKTKKLSEDIRNSKSGDGSAKRRSSRNKKQRPSKKEKESKNKATKSVPSNQESRRGKEDSKNLKKKLNKPSKATSSRSSGKSSQPKEYFPKTSVRASSGGTTATAKPKKRSSSRGSKRSSSSRTKAPSSRAYSVNPSVETVIDALPFPYSKQKNQPCATARSAASAFLAQVSAVPPSA